MSRKSTHSHCLSQVTLAFNLETHRGSFDKLDV